MILINIGENSHVFSYEMEVLDMKLFERPLIELAEAICIYYDKFPLMLECEENNIMAVTIYYIKMDYKFNKDVMIFNRQFIYMLACFEDTICVLRVGESSSEMRELYRRK